MALAWEQLAERDVVKQCCDFLEWHGWKVIDHPSGLLSRPGSPQKRMRVGEVGGADKIAVKPIEPWTGRCYFFFLEFKRPDGKQSPDQELWAERMRKNGYLYVVIESLEGLEAWLWERKFS